MVTFGERVRRRREELGMTQLDLAKLLGIGKSTIGSYETGTSMPRESVLLRLFDVLQVEPNVLFQDSYSAESSPITPGERALVDRYRTLSETGRRAVNALLDAVEDSSYHHNTGKPETIRCLRRVPLFLSPAAAGYASPVLGEEYEMIDASDAPENAQFAIRIQGDSMEPYIRDGSVVYVAREPLQNGDVGIFSVDGDTFCKQYYRDPLGLVYLFSLNRDRADADVVLSSTSGQTLACFGRVLLSRRYPLPR